MMPIFSLFSLSLSSIAVCFCLICITFNNNLISKGELLENISLLVIFVVVVWMWFMVNQVRQDIRDKRIMNRNEEQEDIELVAMDDMCGERTDIVVQTS